MSISLYSDTSRIQVAFRDIKRLSESSRWYRPACRTQRVRIPHRSMLWWEVRLVLLSETGGEGLRTEYPTIFSKRRRSDGPAVHGLLYH